MLGYLTVAVRISGLHITLLKAAEGDAVVVEAVEGVASAARTKALVPAARLDAAGHRHNMYMYADYGGEEDSVAASIAAAHPSSSGFLLVARALGLLGVAVRRGSGSERGVNADAPSVEKGGLVVCAPPPRPSVADVTLAIMDQRHGPDCDDNTSSSSSYSSSASPSSSPSSVPSNTQQRNGSNCSSSSSSSSSSNSSGSVLMTKCGDFPNLNVLAQALLRQEGIGTPVQSIPLTSCHQSHSISSCLSFRRPITTTISSLIFSSAHLVSLSGLEQVPGIATSLLEASFPDCERITSLRPLRHCTALQSLSLASCRRVTSLRALSKAPFWQHQLRRLWLSDTAIHSLEPLRTCQVLEELDCFGCKRISSIAPLEEGLPLKIIGLARTGVTDIGPLRFCTSLVELNLFSCEGVVSLEPLRGLRRLERVWAGRTSITSLEPLRHCRRLRSVYVYECDEIDSLEPLAGLTELEELRAASTSISSLEPLRHCQQLAKIDLANCTAVSNIDALSALTALEELVLSGTRVASLDPLAHCTALRSLSIVSCKLITSVAPLVDLPHLETVMAFNSGLEAIRRERAPHTISATASEGAASPPSSSPPFRFTLRRFYS